MKRIAIFTTTRAEFGILTPLIRAISQSKKLESLLFVGGTHLSAGHGYTISEIEKERFSVTDTFNYISDKTDSANLLKSMAVETNELVHIFNKYEFDGVCVLGDRFELLPIVQAAILFRKVIIHIHGGEKSEGVIDEQIRHMITKASHIHFAACNEYAQNIQKMGESSWRVYNTGALAVDNMKKSNTFSKDELFQELNLDLSKDLVLFTFHPITLETKLNSADKIRNIFAALQAFDLQVIITSPGMEVDRDIIMNEISQLVKSNSGYHYVESLGSIRYLSLLNHCKFVIGNSSSGIIEVPFYKIPTINIGERQKGRIKHLSIIDTDYSVDSIVEGIQKAMKKDFCESIQKMPYAFGNGNTAQKMVEILESLSLNKKLLQKELDFSC